jgi:hypothetical protein
VIQPVKTGRNITRFSKFRNMILIKKWLRRKKSRSRGWRSIVVLDETRSRFGASTGARDRLIVATKMSFWCIHW